MIYGGCAGGNKCRVASVAEAAASVSSRTLIDISRVKLSPPTVSAGHKASVAQLGIFFSGGAKFRFWDTEAPGS